MSSTRAENRSAPPRLAWVAAAATLSSADWTFSPMTREDCSDASAKRPGMARIFASNEAKVAASEDCPRSKPALIFCAASVSARRRAADLVAKAAFGRLDLVGQRVEGGERLAHLRAERGDMARDAVARRGNLLDPRGGLAETRHGVAEGQRRGGERGGGAFHRARRQRQIVGGAGDDFARLVETLVMGAERLFGLVEARGQPADGGGEGLDHAGSGARRNPRPRR